MLKHGKWSKSRMSLLHVLIYTHNSHEFSTETGGDLVLPRCDVVHLQNMRTKWKLNENIFVNLSKNKN